MSVAPKLNVVYPVRAPSYDECEIFVCDCSDASHNIIFQLWDWGKYGELTLPAKSNCELSVHVNLTSYPGFFSRLWLAIKYIFGYKSKYGQYDVMTIRYEDIPRFKAILDKFKDKVDKYAERLNGEPIQ